jgi:uncharacterized protein
MSQIVIDHAPSAEKLDQLGVFNWSIWEKEISKFPLDFGMTESAYLLEGEIHVTPQGGEKVIIKAGDFVVFPKGMKSQWEVVKTLKKHYKHS